MSDTPRVIHYGMFEFKEGTTEEQISHCFNSMADMVGKIEGLLSIEFGAHNSDEGLDDGYTHGFVMHFENAAARDAYLPHPIHEAVKEIVIPCLERVVVLDFDLKSQA